MGCEAVSSTRRASSKPANRYPRYTKLRHDLLKRTITVKQLRCAKRQLQQKNLIMQSAKLDSDFQQKQRQPSFAAAKFTAQLQERDETISALKQSLEEGRQEKERLSSDIGKIKDRFEAYIRKTTRTLFGLAKNVDVRSRLVIEKSRSGDHEDGNIQ